MILEESYLYLLMDHHQIQQHLVDIKALEEKCYKAMNDDFNTPILIAHLFEAQEKYVWDI